MLVLACLKHRAGTGFTAADINIISYLAADIKSLVVLISSSNGFTLRVRMNGFLTAMVFEPCSACRPKMSTFLFIVVWVIQQRLLFYTVFML